MTAPAACPPPEPCLLQGWGPEHPQLGGARGAEKSPVTASRPSAEHEPSHHMTPESSAERGMQAGRRPGGCQVAAQRPPGAGRRLPQAPGRTTAAAGRSRAGRRDPAAPTCGGARASPDTVTVQLHASGFQGEPRAPGRHHPRGRDSRAQVGSAAAPRPEDAGSAGRCHEPPPVTRGSGPAPSPPPPLTSK